MANNIYIYIKFMNLIYKAYFGKDDHSERVKNGTIMKKRMINKLF